MVESPASLNHDPQPGPDDEAWPAAASDPLHDADAEPWPAPRDESADPRAAHAHPSRARGLDAPFAPGGDDAADDVRRTRERRDLRLLLWFVAALVIIPSVLTVIGFIVQLVGMRSAG